MNLINKNLTVNKIYSLLPKVNKKNSGYSKQAKWAGQKEVRTNTLLTYLRMDSLPFMTTRNYEQNIKRNDLSTLKRKW